MTPLEMWKADAAAANSRLQKAWDVGAVNHKRKRAKRGGVIGRPQEIDGKRAVALRSEGMTHQNIADIIGVSRSAVTLFFQRNTD